MGQERREEVSEREELQDKVLTCENCRQEFTWDTGSQEFFRERGFMNEPSRCRECRQAIYLRRAGRAARKGTDT